jgi:hypothetical protein
LAVWGKLVFRRRGGEATVEKKAKRSLGMR